MIDILGKIESHVIEKYNYFISKILICKSILDKIDIKINETNSFKIKSIDHIFIYIIEFIPKIKCYDKHCIVSGLSQIIALIIHFVHVL